MERIYNKIINHSKESTINELVRAFGFSVALGKVRVGVDKFLLPVKFQIN